MSDSSPKSLRFEVSAETPASPERVIEIAGKDFSSRRAEIWPNVRKTRLVVHDRGTDHAEVTEGGTGPARFIWERGLTSCSVPTSAQAKGTKEPGLYPRLDVWPQPHATDQEHLRGFGHNANSQANDKARHEDLRHSTSSGASRSRR
jgi:hypothetical protein